MVEISISNRTSQSLTFHDGHAPWYVEGSDTTLVAVCHDPGHTQLRQIGFIADPTVQTHRLAPGQTISERIFVDGFFEGLMEALGRSDVSIFWDYLPMMDDGKRFGRVGGWLLIPKNGPAGVLLPRK